METIHYDPERILNGFTEDSLKELAKRLRRKIRVIKSDIIQDILSPPQGKSENRVKIWQEINRNLRKELETFSQDELKIFSLGDTPLEEQFKVSYMFTLSSNPEVKAMGEELYCQAVKNRVLAEKDKGAEKDKEDEGKEGDTRVQIDKGDEGGEDEALAALAMITTEVETRGVKEQIRFRDVKELIEAREVIDQIAACEAIEPLVREVKDKPDSVNRVSIVKMPSRGQETAETQELKKRIKTLEKKLKNTNSEGLRTKGQLEKLKNDLVILNAQWQREIAETGKYRSRVRELEVERIEKDKEIEILKKELAQAQFDNLPKDRKEQSGEINLAAYQGRKALIFAERDQDVENRFNALGIIPIWAMEIDWNRPRRRMSTCQIVLYKMNNEKLKKLDEIRDIARYLNIPCDELLNV